ncbi:GINS complex subunit 1 [Intoshia linei]|uniref:DNA replication complex GINS protein PSF1 n=1 Tax=Intoshia linei TaxID=1819745 RepID=A0A177BDX5_9BILA|nr:GINS complex subunit 1 [Intoshia linei]
MYCEKSFTLSKELKNQHYLEKHKIYNYNAKLVKEILQEMHQLFSDNQKDVNISQTSQDVSVFSAVSLRHSALDHNRRTLIIYVLERLKRIKHVRWKYGSLLPSKYKSILTEKELKFHKDYNLALSECMESFGSGGIDLNQDMQAPSSLFVEVVCLKNYGTFQSSFGEVNLTENSKVNANIHLSDIRLSNTS